MEILGFFRKRTKNPKDANVAELPQAERVEVRRWRVGFFVPTDHKQVVIARSRGVPRRFEFQSIHRRYLTLLAREDL